MAVSQEESLSFRAGRMSKSKPRKHQANTHKAKLAKNDEFYTQLPDIEQELQHYRKHFRGAVVYCNCDNPQHSNFWNYFVQNFESLGLTKLVATHYAPGVTSYKLEYFGLGVEAVKTQLAGDGDFRSPECVELLKQADIVVTNPPFSLFREYISLLLAHEKRFLVIGNFLAATYKGLTPGILTRKFWLGTRKKPLDFLTPAGRMQNVNATWFTNLEHGQSNPPLHLTKRYSGNEQLYPEYLDYYAIEVGKSNHIPSDYTGVMGVPISFLHKINYQQFEILNADDFLKPGVPGRNAPHMRLGTLPCGRATFQRLLIRRLPQIS